MEKILPIYPILNFTPNTLGGYGLSEDKLGQAKSVYGL